MSLKVSVTGGNSFLGEQLCQVLYNRGYCVDPISHQECDILNQMNIYERLCSFNPDIVVSLATYSGNINFNQKYCADTFYRTAMINLNTLRACQHCNSATGKPAKVVSVLSSCAIADIGDKILEEEDLHKGPPNKSISSHGYAKRILDIYSQFIREQYGMNCVTCILQNLFGEKDSTDLSKTKVVMSLIKKYVDAKQHNYPSVTNWGSGIAKRELLYVKDAAEAITQVIEKYNEPDPINITSDYEITIKELAEKISSIVGYNGETLWDTTKSDGQLRKKLSPVKMKKFLDLKFTEFDVALTETINWYTKRNDNI